MGDLVYDVARNFYKAAQSMDLIDEVNNQTFAYATSMDGLTLE